MPPERRVAGVGANILLDQCSQRRLAQVLVVVDAGIDQQVQFTRLVAGAFEACPRSVIGKPK